MSLLNDILKAINHTKVDVFEDDDGTITKAYVPYVINRCESAFIDTIAQANEMNRYAFLDKKIQFDYLRHSIRPRNRFAPWLKPEEIEDLEIVKEYFQYNTRNAIDALKILSKSDLDYIRMRLGKQIEKKKRPSK